MISFCRIHSRLSLVEQRILSVCVRVGVPRAGSPLSSRPRRARHTLHEGLRDLHGCDANFGPWTKVATDSHSTWHNGATNTFPNDGTTTEWTPTAPSKYLLVRTRTNHGATNLGGQLTVRFLQLKLSTPQN